MVNLAPEKKTHVVSKRPPFERIALLLQGGGALGAYQGGVYQALTEAHLCPDWVAGISIGAINSALIAGNSPDTCVDRLRLFWETISQSPLGPLGIPHNPDLEFSNPAVRRTVNQARAMEILMFGASNFFKPRFPPPYLQPPGSAGAMSYYDVAPLKATLERLVDFDRINAGEMRFSVGAVNVRTGNFIYFDNTTHKITADHVIASGALPPGFPAIEIDGERYWDGGVVSNTPLQWVVESYPRKDTLAFQVDLWNAQGEIPKDLLQAEVRQKEIRFSSRTRAGTDRFKKMQLLRRAAAKLLAEIPPELRQTPEAEMLAAEADEKVFNIIQLIYHSKSYEGASKDFEFSRRTMDEHWTAGYNDAVRTLRHPEVLQRPKGLDGVYTFDLARIGRR